MYNEVGNLIALQCRLLLAERDLYGNATKFYYCGTTANGAADIKTASFPFYGEDSGYKVKQGEMTGTPSGTLTFDLSRLNLKNLALVTHSTTRDEPTTPVVGEVLPTVVAGDLVALAHVGVNTLSIADYAGTPVTLPEDNYELDADAGMIAFSDVTGFTQPFKASYTPAGAKVLELGKVGTTERWIRLVGVNRAVVPFQKFVIDFYRGTIPSAFFDSLKHEEGKFGMVKLPITLEADPTKTEDAVLGVLGRIRFPGGLS